MASYQNMYIVFLYSASYNIYVISSWLIIDCVRLQQHSNGLIELLKQQIRLTQYSTHCVILQLGKHYQQIADYMTQPQTHVVQ